jgi:alpha-tubulin suppressor-like RCC1 family protein
MAGEFQSPSGNLENILVSDYNMIDQYVGGSLWMVGTDATYGSLGDNTTTNRSSPVQTVSGGTNWKQISCGQLFSASIKTDGTLWLWGDNTYGQLGDNTISPKSSPVQTVAGGTNWKQVSCGFFHTAAIKTDGTLWLWGRNQFGAIGDNTTTPYSSPVQTVSGGNNWKQVTGGGQFTSAIKTDGKLWVWGRNGASELGDGTVVSKSSPVQTAAAGSNWIKVSSGHFHSGAIKTDGTLWMWGYNSFYGSLGDNTTTDKNSPVQTISGGTNWKEISCNGYTTGSIKTDGTLWMWGLNYSGQLGTNDITSYSSPIQTVSADTNWKNIACGSGELTGSTAAVKSDGTLWMWGNNNNGQLGTNNTTSQSSPIQTVAGGTNWKQVSVGSNFIGMTYFYDNNSLYPSA